HRTRLEPNTVADHRLRNLHPGESQERAFRAHHCTPTQAGGATDPHLAVAMRQDQHRGGTSRAALGCPKPSSGGIIDTAPTA
ncbi:MAG: hypothetical protein ACXVH3_28195, partial [Solirubrobacteraceae bacterium]